MVPDRLPPGSPYGHRCSPQLTGDGTERVDTRVLEVIYALAKDAPQPFVGQQMDVFIEADPLGIEGEGAAAPSATDAGD